MKGYEGFPEILVVMVLIYTFVLAIVLLASTALR